MAIVIVHCASVAGNALLTCTVCTMATPGHCTTPFDSATTPGLDQDNRHPSSQVIKCAVLDLGFSSQIMHQVEHNELHTKVKLGECQKLQVV